MPQIWLKPCPNAEQKKKCRQVHQISQGFPPEKNPESWKFESVKPRRRKFVQGPTRMMLKDLRSRNLRVSRWNIVFRGNLLFPPAPPLAAAAAAATTSSSSFAAWRLPWITARLPTQQQQRESNQWEQSKNLATLLHINKLKRWSIQAEIFHTKKI